MGDSIALSTQVRLPLSLHAKPKCIQMEDHANSTNLCSDLIIGHYFDALLVKHVLALFADQIASNWRLHNRTRQTVSIIHLTTSLIGWLNEVLPGTADVWVAPLSSIRPEVLPLANAANTAFLQIKKAGTLYFSNVSSVSFSRFSFLFHGASVKRTACSELFASKQLSYRWSNIFSKASQSSTKMLRRII